MKSIFSANNKKLTLMLLIAVVSITILSAFCLSACQKNNPDEKPSNPEKPALGVWWWDNRLDSAYLDFAASNGITEIYCYYSSFSEKTTKFISAANEKGISVLWLAGKYEWVEDYDSLKEKVLQYLAFQQSSPSKFAGIHLDIEPHQHPEFEQKRQELITKFVELTIDLKNDFPQLRIEYDIPFWLDDEVTAGGVTKPAHQFVIDNSYRVTVMSYRDSAQKILDCAQEEREYAISKGKPINLSVETSDNEDIVTFYQEGNAYMQDQLSKVRDALPANCGIAIHHIKSWKYLAENIA